MDNKNTTSKNKDNEKICHTCHKSISLIQSIMNQCHCAHQFCDKHKLPEIHNCPFDYYKYGLEKDKNNNKPKPIDIRKLSDGPFFRNKNKQLIVITD